MPKIQCLNTGEIYTNHLELDKKFNGDSSYALKNHARFRKNFYIELDKSHENGYTEDERAKIIEKYQSRLNAIHKSGCNKMSATNKCIHYQKSKDILEKIVDKKYYLTNDHIERISNWKAQQKPLENMKSNVLISPTITARGAGEDHSGMVLIDTELFKDGEVVDFDSSDEFRREHSTEESPSLVTHSKLAIVEKNDGGGLPIMEATKKGYKMAYEGDGVDIGGRMASHRGTVQKGLAQTLKTDCDVGVVVEDED